MSMETMNEESFMVIVRNSNECICTDIQFRRTYLFQLFLSVQRFLFQFNTIKLKFICKMLKNIL